VETSYRFGFSAGRDRLVTEAASLDQEISPMALADVQAASEMIFPLKAADLMDTLSGPILGKALKQAETRWIASGFTLTKAELLD
jgi:poly(A) polymerase